jgi:late competence protein required for DNA uptake (superfamily II DNA/RNA helicase)
MKKLISTEINVCDFCEPKEHLNQYDHCYEKCVLCGKHVCSKCSEKVGKTFSMSVFFSGSGDAFYCNQCLISNSADSLLPLYKKMLFLKEERDSYLSNFTRREKEVREAIESYRKRNNIE